MSNNNKNNNNKKINNAVKKVYKMIKRALGFKSKNNKTNNDDSIAITNDTNSITSISSTEIEFQEQQQQYVFDD